MLILVGEMYIWTSFVLVLQISTDGLFNPSWRASKLKMRDTEILALLHFGSPHPPHFPHPRPIPPLPFFFFLMILVQNVMLIKNHT